MSSPSLEVFDEQSPEQKKCVPEVTIRMASESFLPLIILDTVTPMASPGHLLKDDSAIPLSRVVQKHKPLVSGGYLKKSWLMRKLAGSEWDTLGSPFWPLGQPHPVAFHSDWSLPAQRVAGLGQQGAFCGLSWREKNENPNKAHLNSFELSLEF